MLGYHADENIDAVALGVGLVIAAFVLSYCAAFARGLRPGGQGNTAATLALIAALLLLPFVVFLGRFAGALILPAFVPLALLALSLRAVRLVPRKGGKTEAIAAFGISGLTSAYVAGYAVACVAVDACFH